MISIRPISDLRNNFTEISRLVHETGEPIFLTKNGYGDMVVMSLEHYQALLNSRLTESPPLEARRGAEDTSKRYNFEDIAKEIRETVERQVREDNK